MPLYECDPEIELNGQNTYALLSSILRDEFAHIVEKHGLAEIDREQWYPLHKVLAVLEEISQTNNAMFGHVSLGIAAAENYDLPPEVVQLHPTQFLKLYEQLYPKRHRNGRPGSVAVDVLDENHVRITLDHDVPYPDDTMYGVFYGYLRRIMPQDMRFTISYDEEQPRKAKGGNETVMNVVLEPR